MEISALFVLATRNKFRFPTLVGACSLEDLWDLPLTSSVGKPNLDDTAKAVNRQLKSTQEESFVADKPVADRDTEAALEIIKYIIGVKKEENAAARNALLAKEKKQKILELISKKKDSEMEEKSVEELEAMLEEL